MSIELRDIADGLRITLETMAARELETGQPRDYDTTPTFADISAHIPLINGDPACVVLTIPKAAALEIVREIAGTDVVFEDALVADAVGELLNMAVGTAQRHSTTSFNYSLPVIAKSEHHEVRVLEAGAQCVESRLGEHRIALYLVRGISENEVRQRALAP